MVNMKVLNVKTKNIKFVSREFGNALHPTLILGAYKGIENRVHGRYSH